MSNPFTDLFSHCGERCPFLTKNVIVFSSESKFFSTYQHYLDAETLYAKCILGDTL